MGGQVVKAERDDEILLAIDPAGLSEPQCDGGACVVCRKVWPRPMNAVGRLPDSRKVYACGDCATVFAPVAAPAHVELDSRRVGHAGHRRFLPHLHLPHRHVTN
jgi:hypothetical protein